MSTLTAVLALAGTLGVPGHAEEAATAEFLALETKLMGSALLGNQAEVEALVSAEFAYNLALEGRSNYVLNRSEWFKGSRYYKLENFQISHLTAHVFATTAITNFKLVTSAQVGGNVDMSGAYVVTDVWTGGKGRWTLARRFVSRPAAIPANR